MTTSDILLDSTHDYLLRCVQTVAQDCPVLSSSSPDLHRLRNLVMVLQSTSSSPAGPPKRELTLAAESRRWPRDAKPETSYLYLGIPRNGTRQKQAGSQ